MGGVHALQMIHRYPPSPRQPLDAEGQVLVLCMMFVLLAMLIFSWPSFFHCIRRLYCHIRWDIRRRNLK